MGGGDEPRGGSGGQPRLGGLNEVSVVTRIELIGRTSEASLDMKRPGVMASPPGLPNAR